MSEIFNDLRAEERGSQDTLSDLAAGQKLDEQHAVLSIDLIRYPYARTYDILPNSSSGTYFASGALLGSTLTAARSAGKASVTQMQRPPGAESR
ncbi:MAG TPA: hypothetical protein VIK01_02220 [Polyangiaceae bacterium]